ncbi:MAG: hypothetical protein Kow0079_00530 [Vicingaceae bacterium]
MKKIKVWIKLKNYFIEESNIRKIINEGKFTRIKRFSGDDIIVEMDYDKVMELVEN